MVDRTYDEIPLDIIHLFDNKSVIDENDINYEDIDEDSDEESDKLLRQTIGESFNTYLRQIPNIIDVKLKSNFTLNNSCVENVYYKENVFRYSTIIVCKRKNRKYLIKILKNISINNNINNSLFAFNNDCYESLSNTDYISGESELTIDCFRFGSLVDLTQFIGHYDSSERNYSNSRLTLDSDYIWAHFQHQKSNFSLKFQLISDRSTKKDVCIRHKLEYDYKSLNNIIISTNDDYIDLYINLKHPPILYILESDRKWFQSSLYKKNKYPEGEWGSVDWIRENEFNGVVPETIGKCNTLMIKIPIQYNTEDPYSVISVIKRFTKIPIYFANINHQKCVNKRLMDQLIEIELPFDVNYAYSSLFSHTFQASDELLFRSENIEFISKVYKYFETDQQLLVETLFKISSLINSGCVVRTLNALKQIFNNLKKKKIKSNNVGINSFNTDVRDIRRCILTPTRLLLLPPLPIQKSRFDTNSDSDYVLRLRVCEDNTEGLGFTVQRFNSTKSQIDFIRKIVKNQVINGLKVCGRVYQFLGSSTSQLRDNGMILYAKDSSGRSAESIRESVGDLRPVLRKVPKYIARFGLIFSQSLVQFEISKDTKIEFEPDIEGRHKPDPKHPKLLTNDRYIFSDGIGMVSKQIMDKVYEQMPNECTDSPSAIQIRFGGCKGMLALNPKLNGEHIIFRESMKKFDSNDRTLAVLKISAPRPVFLNRPLIAILDQLKVEPKVFRDILSENLKTLFNSLICECSASRLLQNISALCIPYETIFKSGVEFLSESIFREMIVCIVSHRIRELKTKARIRVPMNSGRHLLGVLDETESLEYGQIFARLSRVERYGVSVNNYDTLEGEVMVTKFPCLHPGDVRKFTAVNIPELNHIKDCIVFPGKGERPHPDEMAGSDLDGDEYAIFWDSEFIFKDKNYPPMHFPNGCAQQLNHDVKVEDIFDFYCNYILNNNIGIVANAHLANADQIENGIFNEICMDLGSKYCIALDFAKTGVFEALKKEERPKIYPDFMGKSGEKRTYLSVKVLGQLYRQCCSFETGFPNNTKLEVNPQPNQNFIIEGWEKYESSATKAYLLYKEKIIYLLNRFDIVNEASLLSGAFNSCNNLMTGKTETYDIQELIKSLVNDIFHEFKTRFKSECEGNSEKDNELRAIAWYLITYAFNDNIYGFPWTISEELCKIIDNMKTSKLENHDCVRHSAESLDKEIKRVFTQIDPNIDFKRDHSEIRVKIIDHRFDCAEEVLKQWFVNQELLFFSRYKRNFNHKTNGMTNNVDSELKTRLNAMKSKLINESESLRTIGYIVMDFLKGLVNDWLSFNSFIDNNNIFDKCLNKYGFCSLLALNHFYKSKDISHIIDFQHNSNIINDIQIETEIFQLILAVNEKLTPIYYYLTKNVNEFCEKLVDITGVIEIEIRFNDMNSDSNSFCDLSVSGTNWSIQTLKNLVMHPKFFENIYNYLHKSDN